MVEALEPLRLMAVFSVTTTDDNGDDFNPTPGSLREAIVLANSTAGQDDINFNITGAGPHTIAVQGFALPAIIDTVSINGYTQGGLGYQGAPLIVIDNGATVNGNGLTLSSGSAGSVIEGLSIVNAQRDPGEEIPAGSGILIYAGVDNVILRGNYIGVLPDGTTIQGNEYGGVLVHGDNNEIGDSKGGPLNVISGNDLGGVLILPEFENGAVPTGNSVNGNRIGTDAAGLVALPNFGPGVGLAGTAGTAIRGNQISGNIGDGIYVASTPLDLDFEEDYVAISIDLTIQNNAIGTDVTRQAALGNGSDGIDVEGAANVVINDNLITANDTGIELGDGENPSLVSNVSVVGNLIGVFADLTGDATSGNDTGIDADTMTALLIEDNTVSYNEDGIYTYGVLGIEVSIRGNLIQYNDDDGLYLDILSTAQFLVQGNTITDNGWDGISVYSSNVVIGGPDPGQGNVVANNGNFGIVLYETDGQTPTGVLITRNSIYGNVELGISLGGSYTPTQNTPGGPHEGPNDLQNYPVLGTAILENGLVTLTGTFNSTPEHIFTIEIFSNTEADPSGHGEGRTFLTSIDVATDAFGNAVFSVPLGALPLGTILSATASDVTALLSLTSIQIAAVPAVNNTSEFSANIVVASATTTSLAVIPNPSTLGQTVTLTSSVVRTSGEGVPTGTVSFFDGETLLGTAPLDANGFATLSTAAFALGSHSITAVYNPTSTDAPSTSEPSILIVNAQTAVPTTTQLGIVPNPGVAGQPITFTAVVAGPPGAPIPTGVVTFYNGEAILGTAVVGEGGLATLTLPSLPPGSYAIRAAYEGTLAFEGSVSSPATLVVNVASVATTTTLTGSPNPSLPGQPVVFTAVVAGPPGGAIPVGTVTFFDGTTPLGTVALDAQGVAVFGTAGLGAGPHAITAVYNGGPGFQPSSAPAVTQLVVGEPAPSSTLLVASATAAQPGEPVTFAVTIPQIPGFGIPSGTVTFFDGETPLGVVALDANGQAALTVPGLSPGLHTIRAAYSGNAFYSGSVSTIAAVTVAGSPSVTSLRRFGYHAQPTVLVVGFSGPLAAASAQRAANYTLVGPLNRFGRGGRPIPIGSATYDAATNSVTLRPTRRLSMYQTYRLTIDGSSPLGVTGATGLPLDGSNDGRPGSNYSRTFGGGILAGPIGAARQLGMNGPLGRLLAGRGFGMRDASAFLARMRFGR